MWHSALRNSFPNHNHPYDNYQRSTTRPRWISVPWPDETRPWYWRYASRPYGDRYNRAIFAPPSLRFSLADSTLPLLTTKRTFMRGIAEELLWFIHGCTDSTLLNKKGVKIWDGNGSKEFLKCRGLGHRREGDLGPVYGFQWRHFGAEYVNCETDYTGQGVDQLRECIKKIKENPTDRRIILSAWNPKGLFFYYIFPI